MKKIDERYINNYLNFILSYKIKDSKSTIKLSLMLGFLTLMRFEFPIISLSILTISVVIVIYGKKLDKSSADEKKVFLNGLLSVYESILFFIMSYTLVIDSGHNIKGYMIIFTIVSYLIIVFFTLRWSYKLVEKNKYEKLGKARGGAFYLAPVLAGTTMFSIIRFNSNIEIGSYIAGMLLMIVGYMFAIGVDSLLVYYFMTQVKSKTTELEN